MNVWIIHIAKLWTLYAPSTECICIFSFCIVSGAGVDRRHHENKNVVLHRRTIEGVAYAGNRSMLDSFMLLDVREREGGTRSPLNHQKK